MNDEEKMEEAKKEYHEIPENLKPWLLEHLDEICLILGDKKKKNELPNLFKQLFDKLTMEQIKFEDEISRACDGYLKEKSIKDLRMKSFKTNYYHQVTCLYLLLSFLGHFAIVFNMYDKTHELLMMFWDAWLVSHKNTSTRKHEAQDKLALMVISQLDVNVVREWYMKAHPEFSPLVSLARNEYKNNYEILFLLGETLEKLGEIAWWLSREGRNIIANARSLQTEEKLKKDVIEPFKESITATEERITNLKKETEDRTKELKEGIKDARDNENRMTRNFVQIIGIFAAIIAFIVTIVPTAVRLGGASVAIALAGLAIVTAGIILLLAMIFGREGKRKCGLIVGLIIIGVLFLGWLFITLWAAVMFPDILTTSIGSGNL